MPVEGDAGSGGGGGDCGGVVAALPPLLPPRPVGARMAGSMPAGKGDDPSGREKGEA